MSIWTDVTPMLSGCCTLGAAIRDLPDRVLLHAGPSFADPAEAPPPIRNAAVAAVLGEGWADTVEDADRLIREGTIPLRPAQDHRVVTPLACVVSPSMPVLQVTVGQITALAPINDGPAAGALRFGAADCTAQVARIAEMRALEGPMQSALADAIPLLPLMAEALENGDDLHGSVAAMTALLANKLGLTGAADAYARTPLFALNPVMAAAAAMMQAAALASPEPTVIAAGGNGVTFGWKTSEDPTHWHIRPALPPVGPRMDDGLAQVLPAIGDSAVIDALGLGGPVLRYAPSLKAALAQHHPDSTFAPCPAFLAPHPALAPDISLGLPANKVAQHPGIMLAMLGASGEGLVGRGLAPWPR